MAKEIPLSKGLVSLIDDEDYERVSEFKWSASLAIKRAVYYAVRVKTPVNPHSSLHRFIVNAPQGLDVDHINGDSLDNRRSNLRICTRSQNLMNSKKRRNTSSLYKGVSFDTARGKWQAYANYQGKRVNIGRFDSELDAAKSYDIVAKVLHGQFARLNFPSQDDTNE